MPRSVLVVDDDVAFRALAVRTLRSWDHGPVHDSGTVADALLKAAELRPDVVLVDVGLPDGDGFSLARELTALAGNPRVVLISADPDSADDAAARRTGAVGFVPKAEFPGPRLRRLISGA